MASLRSQRGLAGALLLLVVILGVIALILGRGAFQSGADLDRRGVTDASMKKIAKALSEFASNTRRLPCPARGDLDTGEANPETASATCNTPDGVVPWKTLGLRRDDGLDGWGRKISYRVFDGPTGFTQVDGINMTNCNTSLGAPINTALASGSQCASGSPPPNTPTQYLNARGSMLTVQDLGTARTGNAYVLTSHGASGYGAFPAEGTTGRTTMPSNPGREYDNTQASGTYHILARSSPDIPASNASHFDDIVTYTSITELVANAKLSGRPWSNFSLAATFSASNVNTAVLPDNPTYVLGAEDTGLTGISMGGFRITATSSGIESNVGFRDQSGLVGVGVFTGGDRGDISSSLTERLTFQLGTGSEYGKIGIAFNRLRISNIGPPPEREQADISFWDAGELIQKTTLPAWDNENSTGECLLRLVSGRAYDRIDVAAIARTDGGTSAFTVAGVKACTDSTTPCTTGLAGVTSCSIPPPSASSGTATSVGTSTATLAGTVEDNGIAKGTGAGYRVFSNHSLGATSISLPLVGSGTILAGNCVTFQGDPLNTYIVAQGINGPGTLVLEDPGLLQAISASLFSSKAVTVTNCVTNVSFDYGITGNFGSSTSATPSIINAGSGTTSVSASIGGLTCNTGYFFRTKTVGQVATTTGNCSSFKTAACSDAPPGAVTSDPTGIGVSTSTLNGVVNDNGFSTTVFFDYGLTSCYESSMAATPGSVSAGTGSTTVSAAASGLLCNTTYHYRTRAVSSGGTTLGTDKTFQTSACP